MSLRPLHHILNHIQKQPSWQKQAHYFQLLKDNWAEAVGKKANPHTRLLYIQRDTLWVAVSSAVWAQTLTLQRRKILKKLNQLLTPPLVDLHFSTAQWSNFDLITPLDSILVEDEEQAAPSSTGNTYDDSEHLTPVLALERWKEKMLERSRFHPLCPQCGCHTPIRELTRWQVCAICATKQWQN